MRTEAQFERETYLGNGIHSIDVPTDARGVAMGESFVSLPANTSAMFYNPAGLAGIRSISVSYTRRSMDWIAGLDQMKYISAAAVIPTSVVNIGLLYNRFSQGDLLFTTSQNPEGDGTTVNISDHTIGIGVATQFNERLAFGLSVKTFNMMQSASGPSSSLFTGNVETTRLPVLFDFGIQYSIPFPGERDDFRHQLAAGFSAQNIGSSLKQKQQSALAGVPTFSEHTIKLPRYIRVGFAYGFVLHGGSEEALDPLAVNVTAEYRNSTNSLAARKDYWGFGMEVKLFELASMRMGGFAAPYTSIYGNEERPALRYGFGLSAPFKRLGAEIPVVVNLEYGIIPLNVISSFGQREKTLRTFSVEVQYAYELF